MDEVADFQALHEASAGAVEQKEGVVDYVGRNGRLDALRVALFDLAGQRDVDGGRPDWTKVEVFDVDVERMRSDPASANNIASTQGLRILMKARPCEMPRRYRGRNCWSTNDRLNSREQRRF